MELYIKDTKQPLHQHREATSSGLQLKPFREQVKHLQKLNHVWLLAETLLWITMT